MLTCIISDKSGAEYHQEVVCCFVQFCANNLTPYALWTKLREKTTKKTSLTNPHPCKTVINTATYHIKPFVCICA